MWNKNHLNANTQVKANLPIWFSFQTPFLHKKCWHLQICKLIPGTWQNSVNKMSDDSYLNIPSRTKIADLNVIKICLNTINAMTSRHFDAIWLVD